TAPHKLPSHLALFRLLRRHGLPSLMTQEKFVSVPGLTRGCRAQLLIKTVALSRYFTDGEFGIEHLYVSKLAAPKMLWFGPLMTERTCFEQRSCDSLPADRGQLRFVHEDALAAQAAAQRILRKRSAAAKFR